MLNNWKKEKWWKKMKFLLFGPANAGKTSLLKTTMENTAYVAIENLKPTRGISRETYIFRGLVEISVWDCGGQKTYQNRYYGSQEEKVFSDVDIALYMVDALTVESYVRDEFEKFVKHLLKYNKDLERVYVFINKIDLDYSKEEEIFELLTTNLDPDIHKKCSFWPVSVKNGSAQERLISIIDGSIESRVQKMGRASRLREIMREFKAKSRADFVLFNKKDGLVMTSTFGKFEGSLQFLTFQLSSLDSNVYETYTKIMELSNKKVTPLSLDMLIFESINNFVILKDVENKGTLMCISQDKDGENLKTIIEVTNESSEIYEKLINTLEFSNY
ncbi:MAG: GTPase domain-containing protein [Promethearchaeota archaeon]